MVHITPAVDALPDLGAPVKVCSEGEPVKVFLETEPVADVSQVILNEYKVGEEVQTLRSNGSWSIGAVTEIHQDKIVVSLPSGTKQIRKDMVHQLLRKLHPEEALELQQLRLSCQQAALEVENARVKRERLMKRLQSKSGKPMCSTTQTKYDSFKALCQAAGRKKQGPFLEDKTLILATW